MTKRFLFRAVVYLETFDGHEAWVAQGIEHDIAAQGKTQEDAKANLVLTAREDWLMTRHDWRQIPGRAPVFFSNLWEIADRSTEDRRSTQGVRIDFATVAEPQCFCPPPPETHLSATP